MEIGLPNETGRAQILKIHTARMRENKKIASDVDLQVWYLSIYFRESGIKNRLNLFVIPRAGIGCANEEFQWSGNWGFGARRAVDSPESTDQSFFQGWSWSAG